MLSWPPTVRIFLCATATDMRKGFDSLAQLVQSSMALDPMTGHLFGAAGAQETDDTASPTAPMASARRIGRRGSTSGRTRARTASYASASSVARPNGRNQ